MMQLRVQAQERSQIQILLLLTVLILMITIFIITTYIYCHDVQNLNGKWILDDKGTITMNPIVVGDVPFDHVWTKDFWGIHDLKDGKSHKSWRPLCTITYIWNRMYLHSTGSISSTGDIGDIGTGTTGDLEEANTFWFHVVDRVLHGLVSALVLPVAAYTLLHERRHERHEYEYEYDHKYKYKYKYKHMFWIIKPFLIALLFAVHPIHVEAVANTTGRAEVLCALFYFIAFLIYARIAVGLSLVLPVRVRSSSLLGSIIGVFLMLVFTLAAMLCKEHGVTLPLMAIIWDAYIATNTSIPELLDLLLCRKYNHNNSTIDRFDTIDTIGEDELSKDEIKEGEHSPTTTINTLPSKQQRKQCALFCLRALLCIMGCVTLSLWRLSKNGNSKPDFVCEQNPAACEPSHLFRFFHYSYLWSFNFWLLLYPNWLSPDWSGGSIPLMNEFWATDSRFGVVLLTWSVMLGIIIHTISAACTSNRVPSSLSLQSLSSQQSSSSLQSSPSSSSSPSLSSPQSLFGDKQFELRRRTLLTCFYWMLLPFLMSSNLFVHVGFVVADRTLYLPSIGFCLLLMEALLLIPSLFFVHQNTNNTRKRISKGSIIVISFCYFVVLVLYTWKQQIQTKRWSHPVLIWGEAYNLNPNSIISGTGNYFCKKFLFILIQMYFQYL
jgi:F0F1-type ATP synthase assembly protein I